MPQGRNAESTKKFSLKDGTKVDTDEVVAYETFVSELGAHLNEEMLGNEAFIDKMESAWMCSCRAKNGKKQISYP